jgi:hypothetical protein
MQGAGSALALLLAINLFNYIDRYILAAVEPLIAEHFFSATDENAMAKTGALATAFLVSYMVLAPIFGWLADRFSRWMIIGAGVAVWSLASGWSGMATTFGMLVSDNASSSASARQRMDLLPRQSFPIYTRSRSGDGCFRFSTWPYPSEAHSATHSEVEWHSTMAGAGRSTLSCCRGFSSPAFAFSCGIRGRPGPEWFQNVNRSS